MLLPGEHVVIVGEPRDALEGRRKGLQLRDTLVILLPRGRVLTAFLFRWPLEGTVAENILKHGCGGLWIDGCRIGPNPGYSYNADKNGTTFHGQQGARLVQSAEKRGSGTIESTKGRWPTNMLLVHGPGCVRVGTREVKGITGGDNAPIRRSGAHSEAGGLHAIGRVQNVPKRFHAEDGLETVPAYDCQPDCPVRWLDEMSGERGGTPGLRHNSARDNVAKGAETANTTTGFTDAGGASRFYPQFPCLAEAFDWLVRLVRLVSGRSGP